MRASLRIQARIGQLQPFYRPAMQQVLVHDLLHILHVNESVPDGIRVHHYNRSMLALVQTPQFIGPHLALQPCLLHRIFEGRFQLLAALPGAASTRGAFIALVGADEDVMLELRHFLRLLTWTFR